jgi:hypothetical protein
MSFLISFFVIGIYWMSHHRYFRFIQRYDGRLIMLNLIFLLFIVLMPFCRQPVLRILLFALGHESLRCGCGSHRPVHGRTVVLCFYRYRLVDEHLGEQVIRARSLALAVPLLFLVSIPFAVFSRTLAVAIWCMLPLVSFAILKASECKECSSLTEKESRLHSES